MRNFLLMVSVLNLFCCFLSCAAIAMESPKEDSKIFVNQVCKAPSAKQKFDADKYKKCPNCGQTEKENKISLFINKLAYDSLNEQIIMVCSANIELIKKIQLLNKLKITEEANQLPEVLNNLDKSTCPNCGYCTCKVLENKLIGFLIMNNSLQNVIKTSKK